MTKSLQTRIDQFSRAKLSVLPTPIEPLPRLSKHLGGPAIFVKRDDCTTLALGGNKIRKLEFILGQAMKAGADTIITSGGVQSNHTRQTAAAASRLGLACVLVLNDTAGTEDEKSYYRSGNRLLCGLLGADIRFFPHTDDPVGRAEEVERDLRDQGRVPFICPGAGSTPVGNLGYVAAAVEIVDQCASLGLHFTHIVCTTGSGGTQAGLIAGLRRLQVPARVVGYRAGQTSTEELETVVWNHVEKISQLLGEGIYPSRSDVVVKDHRETRRYAQIDTATFAAVSLVARLEGLLLDPAYTGVAMANLISAIERGEFTRDDTVLFVHTGGLPGIFGYSARLPLSWPARAHAA